MKNLDNLEAYQTIDQHKTLESITFFPKQIQFVWEQAKELKLPDVKKNISSIVFSGMGGSAYAGRIIKSLYTDKIDVPIDIVSDYHLPLFVNEQTLVILVSYSGNTQESLSCCEEALKRNSYIIGITKGGLLGDRLKEANKPVICFTDKYNPSLQPRMGQGYLITGQMAILSKLKYLNISSQNITDLISLLVNQQKYLNPEIKTVQNTAKQFAHDCENRIVILSAAEFLSGAIHGVRNPFHENSKHLAFYANLPEANHHLLEGLSFPKVIRDNLIFLFIKSKLYSRSISIRQKLTREIVDRYGIKYLELSLDFPDKLSQVFELLNFGNYLTYYLAMLHDTDPALIPYVDYFKNKLKNVKNKL